MPCDRLEALLSLELDELGRTGRLFCYEWDNVRPDILIVGKALGGGVYPVSAAIADSEYMDVFHPGDHGSTFGGNPLACAAGLAAIQVTLEEDLPGQAAVKGEFLLRELGCLQQKYPQVLEDAHGKGLLIGMEFPVQEIGWQVASGLFRRGVLVAGTYSRAQVIRIEPALGIQMELLQEMLNRLEDTFREVAKTV